ncbi:MAG: hypothetical protein Q8R29_03265 [bacterium]|nr:hypothetical protein [bacterium]
MKTRADRQEALKLRMKGKTYGEIRATLSIPKSTQSYWFKNLELSTETQKIILGKQSKGLAALQVFNTERTNSIQKENKKIREYYEKEIGDLNKRELALIGASLYWGEGYKNFNQKRGSYPYVGFANSDPQMILIFICFLERILNIKKEAMRADVIIQPNLSPSNALDYWRDITKIPKEKIAVYKALSRASQGKRPKNLLPYGTFQLKISQRQEFFKIRGLIDGIIKANVK